MIEPSVRQQVALVELSHADGIGKVRRLLKLAREVRAKARGIASLCVRFAHRGDWIRANRFRLAFDRLTELHDEIRNKAWIALRGTATFEFDDQPGSTPFTNLTVQEISR